MNQKESLSRLKNFFRMDKNASGKLKCEQIWSMEYGRSWANIHWTCMVFVIQGVVVKKRMQTCCVN